MHVIAHRGFARQIPENSLAGLRYTASQGIESVECDIAVASDDVAVVFHDRSLHRMTSDSRSVLACKSAELGRLPLCFEGQTTAETIPTATQFLQLAHALGLFVHFELKVHDLEVERVVKAAVASIRAAQIPLSQLRISSFSLDALVRCHTRLPEAKYGLACHHLAEVAFVDFQALSIVSVHLNITAATPDACCHLKAQGLEVNLYTVNDPALLTGFDPDCFDGIFTDDPTPWQIGRLS